MSGEKVLATCNPKYLPISFKHSVEICRFIKNKKLSTAISQLEMVVKKELAVPFKRYNRDTPHRKGIASGRYPVKAAKVFIKLLEQLKKNAENKGLKGELVITSARANRSKSKEYLNKNRGGNLTSVWLTVEEVEK